LIKTKYKSKPVSGLTHSIGAKLISDALVGIEIYDLLSISFEKEKGRRMGLFVPGWSSQYMKGESKDLLDFRTVISGKYSAPLEEWSIDLKPVEIENNKLIKEYLLCTGLGHLRNWLETKKNETWFAGRRVFQIGLNENLTQYCIWETYNDRTINKRIEKIDVPNIG